jgi:hypothetical protein
MLNLEAQSLLKSCRQSFRLEMRILEPEFYFDCTYLRQTRAQLKFNERQEGTFSFETYLGCLQQADEGPFGFEQGKNRNLEHRNSG